MRILAVVSLIVAITSVSCVTATAIGQDDVRSAPTPQFAEDVPPLLPMTTAEPAATAAPVSHSSIDKLALIGAAYWLLLGAVALRRAFVSSSRPASSPSSARLGTA